MVRYYGWYSNKRRKTTAPLIRRPKPWPLCRVRDCPSSQDTGRAPASPSRRRFATVRPGMRRKAEIILASQSPRRRELLRQLGVAFRIVPPCHDEQRRPGEAPADYARRNARAKACSVLARVTADTRRLARRCIILGADTIVVRRGRVLEKPRDTAHARAMLRALSGRRHQVITGLCFLATRPPAAPVARTRVVRTDVQFRALQPDEIAAYVATGEPLDKAGAYAIQGRAAHMVRGIHGSYTNVVGLPLAEVAELLKELLP